VHWKGRTLVGLLPLLLHALALQIVLGWGEAHLWLIRGMRCVRGLVESVAHGALNMGGTGGVSEAGGATGAAEVGKAAMVGGWAGARVLRGLARCSGESDGATDGAADVGGSSRMSKKDAAAAAKQMRPAGACSHM
jgi:hypothetical protein